MEPVPVLDPDSGPPPPPPLPQQRSRPAFLGFLSPGEPEEETLPPLETETGEQLDGSGSDAGWLSDELDESSPEDTTSTGSRGGKPGLQLGKAGLRKTAAKGVIIGSGMVHRMATRAETLQREAGLYLADDEDAAAIGHPLADIVARRGGVAGRALSPDANDALSAALGLAGYMSKQIALQMQIAQVEKAQQGVSGPVDV